MVAPSNDKLNELKMVETSTADSQQTFNSWLTLNANDNILELVCCAGSILVLPSPMVSCTALSELALSTYMCRNRTCNSNFELLDWISNSHHVLFQLTALYKGRTRRVTPPPQKK